jgi:hypothetical protein
MIVVMKLSALKEGRWYEHGMRVGLGGLTTLAAGLIGDFWGPAVGGLFLAFPAILCASATLVETHERREKCERGLAGHRRGTDAAALEAAGATLGSLGLATFALAVWLLAPTLGIASVGIGSIIWLLVAVMCWRLRRHVRRPYFCAKLMAKRRFDANQLGRRSSKRVNTNSAQTPRG